MIQHWNFTLPTRRCEPGIDTLVVLHQRAVTGVKITDGRIALAAYHAAQVAKAANCGRAEESRLRLTSPPPAMLLVSLLG